MDCFVSLLQSTDFFEFLMITIEFFVKFVFVNSYAIACV